MQFAQQAFRGQINTFPHFVQRHRFVHDDGEIAPNRRESGNLVKYRDFRVEARVDCNFENPGRIADLELARDLRLQLADPADAKIAIKYRGAPAWVQTVVRRGDMTYCGLAAC